MKIPAENPNEALWRHYLSGDLHKKFTRRHLFRLVPSDPRCRGCLVPFHGIGGLLARSFLGLKQSVKMPTMCNFCDDFYRKHPGGAEVEMGFLFADVRGSTRLAEQMSPAEFSRLLNRFYRTANDILVRSDAWIDKMVGDEVVAFYVPGFTGPQWASKAVGAARQLLEATGHGTRSGPWIPVGVGVHSGVAFFGSIGSTDTVMDVTALGDAVNVASRLAQAADTSEVVISLAAAQAAHLDTAPLASKNLQLKGKSEQVPVVVMKV